MLETYKNCIDQAAGHPFSELARPPLNPRNYRLARSVVERLLDRALGHSDRGTWVTVPMDPVAGAPREPTPIMSNLDFDVLATSRFETSALAQRLQQVLFVPVVKPDTESPDAWCLGSAVLWTPSPSEWETVAADYEAMQDLVHRGLADDLTSGSGGGRILVAKTNGRNSDHLVDYRDAEGHHLRARKRGFYLRPDLVARVLT